nr:hypothetical protein [Tanacetum cinerariifolium]
MFKIVVKTKASQSSKCVAHLRNPQVSRATHPYEPKPTPFTTTAPLEI